ncbi:MAG: DUF3999 family protein [Cyclobacteriaceae bacterium]|nr:DUF3999 family protein [Cyclobacteriaceae bacterium]
MKRKLNLLSILLLLGTSVFAQYAYQRKLPDVTQTGWYRFTLPPAMLTRLKPGFADLRIYAAGNDSTEIPYLVRIAADEVMRVPVAAEPFNVSWQGATLYFTVKLNRVEPVNLATLEFEQENYDADVTVEGSNDQKEWFKLHTGRIIALAKAPVSYTYNHVHFPASEYSYLRFAIKNNTALTLKQVNFHQTQTTKGSFSEVSSTPAGKTIDKQSELLAQFNPPVLLSRLSIEAAPNQLFYRHVTIDFLYDSVRTEKGTHYQYRSMYTGVVSSFKQDTIQFTPQVVNKIRVTIQNQDNPPIQVNRILAWSPRVEIITHLQPGAYALKYGNTNAFEPRYDLEHFVKELPDSLPELQVSSELKPAQTPESESTPWFKNKLWMWIALGAIVAILGYFTMRMMREQ